MLTNRRSQLVDHYEMYGLLAQYGMMQRNSHLLPEGFPAQTIAGDGEQTFGEAIIWCKPRNERGAKHRLFVLCECNKWIPYGRLGQHQWACKAFDFKIT